MKRSIIGTLTLGLLWLGFSTSSALAQSGVDLIVNPAVPVTSLDKNALKDVLLGKTTYWDGGQAVTILLLTDKTDKALEEITGMPASQFKTHWQRLTFSGRGKQPKEVDTPEKLVAAVAEGKGTVALVPSGTELKGVKKLDIKP